MSFSQSAPYLFIYFLACVCNELPHGAATNFSVNCGRCCYVKHEVVLWYELTCGSHAVRTPQQKKAATYLVSHLGYVRTSAGDSVCDPGRGKPLLQSESLLLQLCPLNGTRAKEMLGNDL